MLVFKCYRNVLFIECKLSLSRCAHPFNSALGCANVLFGRMMDRMRVFMTHWQNTHVSCAHTDTRNRKCPHLWGFRGIGSEMLWVRLSAAEGQTAPGNPSTTRSCREGSTWPSPSRHREELGHWWFVAVMCWLFENSPWAKWELKSGRSAWRRVDQSLGGLCFSCVTPEYNTVSFPADSLCHIALFPIRHLKSTLPEHCYKLCMLFFHLVHN